MPLLDKLGVYGGSSRQSVALKASKPSSLVEVESDDALTVVATAEQILGLDLAQFQEELSDAIDGEVRFDEGTRALYATDASNYRAFPIGVVIPKHREDVERALAICSDHDVPVASRGGGTSLAGNSFNFGIVIDYSKYMNELISLDPDRRLARVMPGLILDDLRNAAERHHLTFAPDPATHNRNTLGGMIGNNSCGVHSVMAGRTSDNVREMEVVLYDGTRMTVGPTSEEELEEIIKKGGPKGRIYEKLKEIRDRYGDLIRERYPKIPRRVSGYNLDELLPENGFNVARALVGTEGTCVAVVEATVELVHSPPVRIVALLGFDDVYKAADAVPLVMSHDVTACEGIDDRLYQHTIKEHKHQEGAGLFPAGKGWLLVEFGGETQDEAVAKAKKLMKTLDRSSTRHVSHAIFVEENQKKLIWELREAGLATTAFSRGERDSWPGWEDSAVHPENLGDYLRDLRSLFEKYGYNCAVYGHFGQGLVHVRIDFDLITAEGIKKYRSFMEEATDLVKNYGGVPSGEHGDGQARAEFLPKIFGKELIDAFREFKEAWDPRGKMNPGRVVDPLPIDVNLRLGAGYSPMPVKTHFSYPEDGGSFAHATLRCVGVGMCRRMEGGTMCPSYKVTREERHTTRGRAHSLFEMMQGDLINKGWRDENVKEALDLCLACKGCKSDCPVNVDMATYKAEFLAHYYEGRLRPRYAYAFGLINYWARIGSKMPRVVNFLSKTAPFKDIVKLVGGIARPRAIPSFATETFRDWFAKRGARNEGLPRVILWADTFTNHFHPKIAKAATEVLEAAGYQVVVPREHLCCGRPLYDYGMLDLAKSFLNEIVHDLKEDIEKGTPIVGLEPSCVAVFRDEMTNLLPHDVDARRLAQQTFMFSEFLVNEAKDFAWPKLRRKAVVHGHCHQKSVLGMTAEKKAFEALGLDFEILDSGCCGMAGSFGFEEGKYDVSMAIGESVLLPKVRDADRDTLVIANGFSCQEQIEQATERKGIHLAEVVHMALVAGEEGVPGEYPERHLAFGPDTEPVQFPEVSRAAKIGVLGAGLAVGAVVAYRMVNKARTPAPSL